MVEYCSRYLCLQKGQKNGGCTETTVSADTKTKRTKSTSCLTSQTDAKLPQRQEEVIKSLLHLPFCSPIPPFSATMLKYCMLQLKYNHLNLSKMSKKNGVTVIK